MKCNYYENEKQGLWEVRTKLKVTFAFNSYGLEVEICDNMYGLNELSLPAFALFYKLANTQN